MISNWFLSFLSGLISVVGYVIPNVNFSSVVTDAGGVYGSAMGLLVFLSPIVNVGVLFDCVQVLIDLLIAGFTFRLFNWVFNHIPFVGAFSS